MYLVIVSFGVIVSFRFSVFIVKGIFGVHATGTCISPEDGAMDTSRFLSH